MKLALLSILLMVASGCSRPVETVIGVETLTIKVTGYSPPKHFYIDFDVISSDNKDSYYTGKHFERVYVSKHCNGVANSGILGGVANIKVIRYKDESEPDKIFYKFDLRENIYNLYCGY